MQIDHYGTRRHLYTDKLRKYHLQVDEIVCNSYMCFGMLNECYVNQYVSVIYEHDQDFGDVEVTDHVNDKCKKQSL